jgi:hypothetical protein
MADNDELALVAPEFFVPNVDEAVRFYCDKLGFRLLRADPAFAIVMLGQAVVMLAHESLYPPMAPGERRGAWRLMCGWWCRTWTPCTGAAVSRE